MLPPLVVVLLLWERSRRDVGFVLRFALFMVLLPLLLSECCSLLGLGLGLGLGREVELALRLKKGKEKLTPGIVFF